MSDEETQEKRKRLDMAYYTLGQMVVFYEMQHEKSRDRIQELEVENRRLFDEVSALKYECEALKVENGAAAKEPDHE